MKSFDKLPTPENLDEVAENDVLNRNQFIADFIRHLTSSEGHYSIVLDGRWGTGKTFFIKQTERVIKEFYNVNTTSKQEIEISFVEQVKKKINKLFNRRRIEIKKIENNAKLHAVFENLFPSDLKDIIAHHMMTFYYDAWQHDNLQDSLLSLVFEIAKNATSINPQLKLKLSITDKFYKGMFEAATGIINHISGIDLTKVMNDKNEILHEIQRQDDLESLLKKFFENLLPDKSTRLFIFIDELDRCKPDYAVQLLERIKHYMTFDRITFVFAVNIEQLQHTIKRYYGDDFDASSYLDRFFDYPVSLPDPSLAQKRNIFPMGKNNSFFADWCHYLAEEFNFTLRERAHFFELIQHTLHSEDDNIFSQPIPTELKVFFNSLPIKTIKNYLIFDRLKFTIVFLKFFIVPLSLAFRINNISDYYSFIDGKRINGLDVIKLYLNRSNILGTKNMNIFYE